MTNRAVLEELLIQIQSHSISQQSRADFALSFIDAIESLEDISFSIIDKARDWQYRIETEGYVDQKGFENMDNALLAGITHWLKTLLKNYS